MDSKKDNTKEVLSGILADLYQQQSQGDDNNSDTFLIAANNQYLGRITDNKFDNASLLNKYGPYGSKYSPTSILNEYSQYGSKFGVYSINNPYTTTPPRLFVKGKFKSHISTNANMKNRITPDIFYYNLNNNLTGLMKGDLIHSALDLRLRNKESFIVAHDGTYLGSLKPNMFDQTTIFNDFGSYGNKFSQTSIFNQYSNYGGQFSQLSPFNSFSKTPPSVYVNGSFVAYLTKNIGIQPRIDPDTILDWSEKNVNRY